MRKIKYWEKIQKHPDFFDYDGSDKDLRDQRGQNPIVINLKKSQWYDDREGKAANYPRSQKVLNTRRSNSVLMKTLDQNP